MEDNMIIDLFWQRSESAISQASLKYGAYCRSIALRILENAESSEECVNDTWLRAWNAMPPQKPENLRAFLGKITRNLSLNRLRELSREKRGGGVAELYMDELCDCVADKNTPERLLEDAEITESINRWLAVLSQEQRVAFVRRYWYFDDLNDLASRMGWSHSKTNSLLRRLRESLGKHLTSEGIEI